MTEQREISVEVLTKLFSKARLREKRSTGACKEERVTDSEIGERLLFIRKDLFEQIALEILSEQFPDEEYSLEPAALSLLHDQSEAYVVSLMEHANAIAQKKGKDTVFSPYLRSAASHSGLVHEPLELPTECKAEESAPVNETPAAQE